MRIPQVILGVGLVVLLVLLVAVPQRRRVTYDPSGEVRVVGTVQDVQDFYCPVSGTEGTHLLVATQKGTIKVHVAPADFLQGNHWSFKDGDRVEVVGSNMHFAGHDAIVARTILITGDNVTLSLRKPDGKPLWVE